MFSTFSTTSEAPENKTTKTTTRTKRKQVVRACDRCRSNRIKCDDEEPCRNCQSRGSVCSNSRLAELRKLPGSSRQSIRKPRGKTLESQSAEARQEGLSGATGAPVNTESSEGKNKSERSTSVSKSVRKTRRKTSQWAGAWLPNSRGGGSQYYGRTSSLFFISRMEQYLRQVNGQIDLSDPFGLERANTLSGITASSPSETSSSDMHDYTAPEGAMTRQQEVYYLNLFWQSYHLVMPILDEQDFQRFYRSLWTTDSAKRRPSALVDIMLALCVQYSAAFMSQDVTMMGVTAKDASVAGTWLYQRSQRLLLCEQEQPSLSTVQSHIFAVMFLTNSSMLNTAYQLLAVAIRTGHILGLNHGITSGQASLQDESNQQLVWRSLFLLDSKVSLELGRPFLIDAEEIPLQAPLAVPISNSKPRAPHVTFNDIDIFEFHRQYVELFVVVRDVYQSFNDKCTELLAANEGIDFYENSQMLEESAQHLLQSARAIQKWTQNVPVPLTISRKGNGQAFSTSRSPLDTDAYVPLWLQRQRLLLELLYHNLIVSLYRPFINLPPKPRTMEPISSDLGILCVNHAIVTTNIISQMMAESDVLSLVHTTYKLQWDAMITLIGFSLAHPLCPHAASARKATQTSINTFKIIHGNNLGAASVAADVAKNLYGCIEALATQLQDDSTIIPCLPTPPQSIITSLPSQHCPASQAPECDRDSFSAHNIEPNSFMTSAPDASWANSIPLSMPPDTFGVVHANGKPINGGVDTPTVSMVDGFAAMSGATLKFPFDDNFLFDRGPAIDSLDEWADWVVDHKHQVGQDCGNMEPHFMVGLENA